MPPCGFANQKWKFCLIVYFSHTLLGLRFFLPWFSDLSISVLIINWSISSVIQHFWIIFVPSLSDPFSAFGEVFASIGVREPQPAASEAFTIFGEAHRSMEKFAIRMLKTLKPMISDLNTFLHKAVPDTRLTIKKYLDAKFEYLVGALCTLSDSSRTCVQGECRQYSCFSKQCWCSIAERNIQKHTKGWN